MFRPVPAIVAVCSVVGVAACGLAGATASAEREAEARALLEDLAADRDEALVGKMSAEVNVAEVRAQLPFMKTLVPEGGVPAGTVEGWRAYAGTGGSTYEIVQTYDYPDRLLRASTIFRKEGEVWKVHSFHIAPTLKPGATVEVVEPAKP